MNCRNFVKNLDDYLDGGLDFSGRFNLEKHAEQCFTCGKKLSDASRLRQLTKTLMPVSAPANFEVRVSRAIARRKSRGWRARLRDRLSFGFTWPIPMRLASVLIICVTMIIAVTMWQYSPANRDTQMDGLAKNPAKETMEAGAMKLLLVGPAETATPDGLPHKIYMRYGPPSEEYFITNVSH